MSEAVVNEKSSMASQCMAFFPTLASQGKAFKLSLKIGEDFSFFLDTKKEVPVQKIRKVSPSTKKRNALRRQKFLAFKSKPILEEQDLGAPSSFSTAKNQSVFCEECGHTTKIVAGVKLHVKNKHEISQVDGNTSLPELFHEEETIQNPSCESAFKCDYCEYKNFSKEILREHMKKHKNHQTRSPPRPSHNFIPPRAFDFRH